jgi:hypothetical protein
MSVRISIERKRLRPLCPALGHVALIPTNVLAPFLLRSTHTGTPLISFGIPTRLSSPPSSLATEDELDEEDESEDELEDELDDEEEAAALARERLPPLPVALDPRRPAAGSLWNSDAPVLATNESGNLIDRNCTCG